jgi:chromosome segregation ATPase
MTNVEIPSTDPGRSRRIEEIVGREMNRSRNLLRLYSILLVIPLGACALYYHYGRTDLALVQREVNANIAPFQRIVEQTEPALAQVRQTAGRLSAQETRLESLVREQEAIAAAAQALPQELQQIDSIRTEIDQRMESVEAMNKDLSGSVGHSLTLINDQIASVSQHQNQIEHELGNLSARVERLNPSGYDDQFHKQQELIDSLRKKIQEIEQGERVKPQGVRPQ